MKCIYTANLKPIIVEPIIVEDELRTNVDEIKNIMNNELYKDKILCVLTTTSCFAPRAYDSVIEVAKLCKD